MNSINRRLLQLIVILFLPVFSGCGGNRTSPDNIEPQIAENFYIGTEAVYAYLVQGSGGNWMLGTVTKSDSIPHKGYLVRLNDLAPAFDIRTIECEPQAYPANHRCNPAQPFRDKQIGVVDRLINGGIAAGTAGKVTDFSRTYETEFDAVAFNRAVDEALINTGLDQQRREFLNALERYEMLAGRAQSELAANQEDALNRYKDVENVSLNIRPTIVGITDYYSDDIDFRDLVTIEPRTVRTSEVSQQDEQDILPCEAQRCAQEASLAIDQLQNDFAHKKQTLTASLEKETSNYVVNCDGNFHDGYEFALECPESIQTTNSNIEAVPVVLNILSRDFDAIYPEIQVGDENLSVAVENNEIRFTNLTADYLSVTAQTVYYNNQVETNSERIEIAPGAAIVRPVDDFVTPTIRIEASYRQMTPDKADRTYFQFGVAASYRRAGAATESTLYDLRSFKVGCVIDNRLRPGSCRPPTVEQVSNSNN